MQENNVSKNGRWHPPGDSCLQLLLLFIYWHDYQVKFCYGRNQYLKYMASHNNFTVTGSYCVSILGMIPVKYRINKSYPSMSTQKNNQVFPVKPTMLVWARERAGISLETLAKKFPKLAMWEAGEATPTLRQLENFADAVHIPIGYLFLPEPLNETLPVADFRTVKNTPSYSANLRDVLFLCQERQNWYREHARTNAFPALQFIGSATTASSPVAVARNMEEILELPLEERMTLPNWETALRQLIAKIEKAGVLVMTSSVVGSNAQRKLDVGEFRGFALADSVAPLIFVNGADSKAAQMFTLVHELAHLWLGKTGVSNANTYTLPEQKTEHWCNSVAAEFLMPLKKTQLIFREDSPLTEEISRLTRVFKVSSLVVLYRLCDAGLISKQMLRELYKTEISLLQKKRPSSSGGDFYQTLGGRASKRFTHVLLASTLGGHTLFRDAFRLLGIRKNSTFFNLARKFGLSA